MRVGLHPHTGERIAAEATYRILPAFSNPTGVSKPLFIFGPWTGRWQSRRLRKAIKDSAARGVATAMKTSAVCVHGCYYSFFIILNDLFINKKQDEQEKQHNLYWFYHTIIVYGNVLDHLTGFSKEQIGYKIFLLVETMRILINGQSKKISLPGK